MANRRTKDDADSWDEEQALEEDGGPSAEDLRRFAGDLAHCPACGAEVYDDAVECPICQESILGSTERRPPIVSWWRNRWIAVIVALLVLGVLGLLPLLLGR